MSDVIVVGAGLSGMSAAWELHKNGHDVLVLEARNRVGGRTWTEKFDDGTLTERGGEWVFPIEHEVRQLGAELRLPIMSHGVRYSRRTLGGIVPTTEDLAATTALVHSTMKQMRADGLRNLSVDDVYGAALGAGFQDDPIYRRLVISLSSDPAKASAEATIMHESATAGVYVEDGGRFVGGMQSVTLEIANRLGNRIRLESPVAGVDQSANGVQVSLSDGSTLEADAAVVTVPLPILRQLQFGFALHPKQQRALDHRHMGTAAKLGVPISAVDDDPGVQHPSIATWSWHSLAFDGSSRIPALSNFAGGEAALRELTTDSGTGTWLEALKSTRPEMELAGAPILTDWTTDPWAQGSYSAAGVEWEPEDVNAFDTANGRVALGGEHTGVQQSLNGAVRSGFRAAEAIRKALDVA